MKAKLFILIFLQIILPSMDVWGATLTTTQSGTWIVGSGTVWGHGGCAPCVAGVDYPTDGDEVVIDSTHQIDMSGVTITVVGLTLTAGMDAGANQTKLWLSNNSRLTFGGAPVADMQIQRFARFEIDAGILDINGNKVQICQDGGECQAGFETIGAALGDSRVISTIPGGQIISDSNATVAVNVTNSQWSGLSDCNFSQSGVTPTNVSVTNSTFTGCAKLVFADGIKGGSDLTISGNTWYNVSLEGAYGLYLEADAPTTGDRLIQNNWFYGPEYGKIYLDTFGATFSDNSLGWWEVEDIGGGLIQYGNISNSSNAPPSVTFSDGPISTTFSGGQLSTTFGN